MKKLILPLALLCLSGCVTTGKYKALESQAQGEKLRAAGLEEQLQASKKDAEGLSRRLQDQLGQSQAKVQASQEELASVKTRVSSLEDSNKDLRQSLEANKGELTKKVSDLSKDKDILARKLSDASSEFARRLDAAVADRKALEAVNAALEKAKEEEVARVKGSFEQLAAGLKAEIAAGEIQLTQLKGRLTVNMVDRILFDSGESAVKPDGRKVLNNIARVLKGVADKDIRIEGHTDNVPIGGELKNRFATNWELSTARATAVARFLQDSAKLEPSRLVATGYGEYRPVASNDTPEHKALNRRIEIVLVPKE